MKVLVQQTRILDPQSPFHQSVQDILFTNGRVTAIASSVNEAADQVITGHGLHICPGFTDTLALFGEPGLEHKETLETGSQAALAGGFTNVLLAPNTRPVVYNKTGVEFLVQQSAKLPVHLHPAGAITAETAGKELAEMLDMRRAGAVAFTDGFTAVQQNGILLKALQYVKAFNGVIIQVPADASLTGQGLAHEGIHSTRLGLPGIPALAEELMVHRDIELCAYTGSRLHLSGISTARSAAIVQQAKARGLQVTCSVTPYHLHFCDEHLAGYDTNYKVNPPLRTMADRNALRQALLNGVIDTVASHHQPHEWDAKQCEFEYARFGMEGLESSFHALAAVPGITAQRVYELLSLNPRTIFGLATEPIAIGSQCSATLFSMDEEMIFTEAHIRSRSKNNAFIGVALKGRIRAVINKNQVYLSN